MKKRKKIKKKSLKKIILILGIFLIILISLNFYFKEKIKEKKIGEEILDLKDFKEVEVKAGLGVVFLVDKEDSCKVLPVYVSLEQSYAILEGLNRTAERPMTHDLIKDVLEDLGIEKMVVKVVELKEGTYYAELVLEKEGKIFKIDSRPSDGIAISLRMGSKVYVKEELLLEYGTYICGKEIIDEKWGKEIEEVF